jgi:hypothetical protein
MTKQSLTQEELSQLQSLRTTQSQLISSLGETEYQISLLEEKKQLLKTQVLELEKTNREIGEKLTQKYGSNGVIDIETGEITIE